MKKEALNKKKLTLRKSTVVRLQDNHMKMLEGGTSGILCNTGAPSGLPGGCGNNKPTLNPNDNACKSKALEKATGPTC